MRSHSLDHPTAALVHAVSIAPTVHAIAASFMDRAAEAFGAFASGFYLLGEDGRPAEIHVGGLPERFVESYERQGREVDPLLAELLRRHSPVDETCLFDSVEVWTRQLLFVRCSAPFDVGHYLLGPIVADGQLVGTMNFGRRLRWRPFSERERAMMAALSAHVSAKVSALRAREVPRAGTAASDALRLTAREQQIAELVAAGLTNRRIAERLWIGEEGVKQALKRIFRKAGVGNRAALTARLLR